MSFSPHPSLSRCSSREEIYREIDSLSLFHQHLTFFEKAPSWEKLYACIRSYAHTLTQRMHTTLPVLLLIGVCAVLALVRYKRSHPAIADIETAFQHHRLQVLGKLTEELKTPSIDRLRKRKDRAAKRGAGDDATTPTIKKQRFDDDEHPPHEHSLLPLSTDLSATLSLSSIHTHVGATKDASPRCGCGTMVEANRLLREELRRKNVEIAALREKLNEVRRVVGATEAECGVEVTASSMADGGGAVVADSVEMVWPEFFPAPWPDSGKAQCNDCSCCSWKLC